MLFALVAPPYHSLVSQRVCIFHMSSRVLSGIGAWEAGIGDCAPPVSRCHVGARRCSAVGERLKIHRVACVMSMSYSNDRVGLPAGLPIPPISLSKTAPPPSCVHMHGTRRSHRGMCAGLTDRDSLRRRYICTYLVMCFLRVWRLTLRRPPGADDASVAVCMDIGRRDEGAGGGWAIGCLSGARSEMVRCR